MKNGLFVVFEGGEGSGKSTQARLLAEWLTLNDHAVLMTKEPGGDDGVCADIRACLLNPKYSGKFSGRAEMLLFEADRAQHVDKVVRPGVAEGRVVVCDRYEASTYAYQVRGRKVSSPLKYAWINAFATDRLRPDFSFWIDLDPAVGLRRNVLGKKRDRFEMEDISFHQDVRQGFGDYFGRFPKKGEWQKFDGEQSAEDLHAEIVAAFMKKFLTPP